MSNRKSKQSGATADEKAPNIAQDWTEDSKPNANDYPTKNRNEAMNQAATLRQKLREVLPSQGEGETAAD
jgi:hypothetical protein